MYISVASLVLLLLAPSAVVSAPTEPTKTVTVTPTATALPCGQFPNEHLICPTGFYCKDDGSGLCVGMTCYTRGTCVPIPGRSCTLDRICPLGTKCVVDPRALCIPQAQCPMICL
jgi:hypothetical protein